MRDVGMAFGGGGNNVKNLMAFRPRALTFWESGIESMRVRRSPGSCSRSETEAVSGEAPRRMWAHW